MRESEQLPTSDSGDLLLSINRTFQVMQPIVERAMESMESSPKYDEMVTKYNAILDKFADISNRLESGPKTVTKEEIETLDQEAAAFMMSIDPKKFESIN